MRVEEHFSAGGVVYRVVSGQMDVVLCGRDAPPLWGLPKGTPDAEETPEETALREVKEETGLEVVLEDDLGEIEYWFSTPDARVHKRVQFFLMTATGGSTEAHDPEFDRVSWFPVGPALKTLTHAEEVDVVSRAVHLVRTGEGEGKPHAARGR